MRVMAKSRPRVAAPLTVQFFFFMVVWSMVLSASFLSKRKTIEGRKKRRKRRGVGGRGTGVVGGREGKKKQKIRASVACFKSLKD